MSGHRSYTAIAVLLLASPLAAQGVAQDTLTVNVTPSSAIVARSAPDPLALLSPTRAPAWTAVNMPVTASVTPARTFLGPESSQSGAMMIVGGAAMLVGAIVSGKPGTILMVGGGVLGLVGLWRYSR